MLKQSFLQLSLALIIILSAQISFQFSFLEGNISLFWMPAGVSLASFLLLGEKIWPAVAIGSFVINSSIEMPWTFSLAVIPSILQPWLATIAINRWKVRCQLDTLHDLGKFLAITVIALPILGGIIGASSFCLSLSCTTDNFFTILFQWAVGDAMGVLIITPLILTWVKSPLTNISRKRFSFILGFTFLIITNLFIFGIIEMPFLQNNIYPFQYLSFPFLIWAGYEFKQPGATLGIFITVLIAIWGTMQETGPFSQADTPDTALLLLWSFFTVISLATLILGTASSENEKAKERLQNLADYDALTKLPNRRIFYKAVDDFINICKIKDQNSFCAVLFIDLNRFKEINNSLGHPLGNQVLYQVAQRLRLNVPKQYLVARLGGEEFGIFLPNVRDLREAIIIAETILNTFRSSFQVNDVECFISLTIGINLGSCSYEKSDNIIRDADVAMCNAKQKEKGYCIFNPEMLAKRQSRLTIDQKLRKAITKEELSLFYQPIVDLSSGQITGFESLIRWYNQELGRVSPNRFIPIAEETGVILEIGEWVLKQAFHQLKQWEEHTRFDGKHFTLSVNVSPRQLKGKNFVEEVGNLIRDYNIDPKIINLEITETAILELDINKVVSELKEVGVGIYLDDFGTGESSLSRLYQLPLDVMKIDRAFVQELPDNKRKYAIAQTIINLAKNMDLDVIAEGIETEAQRQQLLEWGCEKGQGFLFYRPLTAEQATNIISGNCL
ncbi:EAL domain-containing protein [Euhalothece natronophila Z-M001]|uniref:EAL domain-containing protein n=1 Tax=Euhalothece natronophila Z-M001 TaxID=522448 RepID=A0A5B8NLW3_9CHRO|nr:EAL domain-containing protein [Euhalothece natronophila]QDZ40006.1 EAL domain-containing protein [Euhalothece natronophila Z-M001]